MLGKTFPPSLRTNHEPTPYHYAQQMGLSAAKSVAETRALSPRRKLPLHSTWRRIRSSKFTAQLRLKWKRFQSCFTQSVGAMPQRHSLRDKLKLTFHFDCFSFLSGTISNHENVNLVSHTKSIATAYDAHKSHSNKYFEVFP